MHVYDLCRADGCSNLIVTKLVVSAMQICSWVDRTRMLLQRISCQRYVPQIASLQLKFCHSKLRAVFGFSKCAYNYYSEKKNLPGLIQKWGRVLIGVKSPHLL